jgi:hypothetical protein
VEVRKDLHVELVETMDEVLRIALDKPVVIQKRQETVRLKQRKLSKKETTLPQ